MAGGKNIAPSSIPTVLPGSTTSASAVVTAVAGSVPSPNVRWRQCGSCARTVGRSISRVTMTAAPSGGTISTVNAK